MSLNHFPLDTDVLIQADLQEYIIALPLCQDLPADSPTEGAAIVRNWLLSSADQWQNKERSCVCACVCVC